MTIARMKIAIPESEVLDLRDRLEDARWPQPIAGYGWNDGTDRHFLHEFVEQWRTRYDWRQREASLNALEHYLADIDGDVLHFIHARSDNRHAVPLLMLHGWPSSFIQMLEIIPLLTAPRDDGMPAFHVVAASPPGYPFTRLPEVPGMNFARIADLMFTLMTRELGYNRFAVRGSDQGGLVLQQLGLRYRGQLIGLHRSGITPFSDPPPNDLTYEERIYQERVQEWAKRETAYATLQRTRPETLLPALTDSPLGLASWFLEKFQRWGDCRRGMTAVFGLERLMDNLSLHWFTGAAAGATRLYREAARDAGDEGRVEVPTAITMALHDGASVPAPRSWCERSYNVARWTVLSEGGHFLEWEVPHVLADDIRQFFGAVA